MISMMVCTSRLREQGDFQLLSVSKTLNLSSGLIFKEGLTGSYSIFIQRAHISAYPFSFSISSSFCVRHIPEIVKYVKNIK